MAQIIDASGVSGGLAVENTAKASRSILYNSDGATLGKFNGANSAVTDVGIPQAVLNDDTYRIVRGDRLGSTSIAWNNILFTEQFDSTVAATLNVSKYVTAITTMTQAQTLAGGLSLNNGAITTINTGALVKSNKLISRMQRAPIHGKFRARANHVTNSVIEIGFGNATTFNGAHTNGIYFQITTSGQVQGVVTYNGVDTTSPLTLPVGWQNNFWTWDVIFDDDQALFFVQDTSTGFVVASTTIKMPTTSTTLIGIAHLPIIFRIYNSGSAPATAPNLIMNAIDVIILDANMGKSWGHTLGSLQQGAAISPTVYGTLQTANFTNSTAPTSASLSNTTAGYTTLGGFFQFAAVAGAVTDYALFGFTVPSPYSLYVTGIDIDTWNTGAAVATTPTLLVWGAGVNQSAVSLATANIVRTPIGVQSFAVGSAVGTAAQKVFVNYDVPLVTDGGRFFTVILRMPVGTATASQIIQGMVNIRGYFE